MPLSLTIGYFVNYKKDRFKKVYESNGELVPFFDMEHLRDTQYCDKYALPDFYVLDSGRNSLMTKVMNLLRKEGTSKIVIYLILCMLVFQNIKSKR